MPGSSTVSSMKEESMFTHLKTEVSDTETVPSRLDNTVTAKLDKYIRNRVVSQMDHISNVKLEGSQAPTRAVSNPRNKKQHL